MRLQDARLLGDDLTTVTSYAPDHLTVVVRMGSQGRQLATITVHPTQGATVEFAEEIAHLIKP